MFIQNISLVRLKTHGAGQESDLKAKRLDCEGRCGFKKGKKKTDAHAHNANFKIFSCIIMILLLAGVEGGNGEKRKQERK